MDFLDPKKKKAHRIKLFIGYGLVAVALGFCSVILFYQYYYGYRLDPKTGQIVQNGLVFINAQPEPADVTLNGESKGQTDQRLDIPSGNYTLELSRGGYRTWKREFTLEGGRVERFVYPFLFPENLDTQDLQLYSSAPTMATTSPDRRWLLVAQPGSVTTYDLTDITTEAAASQPISLPSGLLQTGGENHSVEIVEWSSNNRHVLLKHIFDGGQEFFVLDTEAPVNSVNLTRAFATPFTAVALRDKKFDQYYLHDQARQSLQVALLENRQLQPYLTGVLSFRAHGADVVVYVTGAEAPEGKALLKVREGEEDYDLRELSAGSAYFVDVARFDGAWYFVGSSAADQRAYVYRNPVSAIKRRPEVKPVPVGVLRLDKAPEAVSFSHNARFVALQGGSQFSVYDAETDRQYRYETGLPLTAGQKVVWMDGHRLAIVSEAKTIIFDYDGTNRQILAAATAGSVPMFDRDYEALFNIAPSQPVAGRFAITRTELRVADE